MASDRKAGSATALQAVTYGLINVSSTVAIVLANKLVYTACHFSFPVALTFIHTIVTWLGIWLMAAAGVFEVKAVPVKKSVLLAAAHSGCIVLNNVSLHLNTVGFYQISKIAQTPAVLFIETMLYGRHISMEASAAVGVLLVGVVLACVSDPQVTSNPFGALVAFVNISVAALNSVWTGTMQVEAGVNGNQLLHAMAPYAAALLAPAVPLIEPLGLINHAKDTILGFQMTTSAAVWILLSAVLGLVVTQSACLFIGATSGTTYSVVSHSKTLLIVIMGVQQFGDSMTTRKSAGLALAVAGMVWYTYARRVESLAKQGRQQKAGPLEEQHPLLPISVQQQQPGQYRTVAAAKAKLDDEPAVGEARDAQQPADQQQPGR